MTFLGKLFDERFMQHRRRSTSVAGMAGGLVAATLFYYRLFAQHQLSWDLLAVLGAMVLTKLAMMAWYALND
ncbi:MAG: hypothetical protein ACRENS_08895 [Candidatus Eiseniibacteriota bacterium]